MEDDARPGLAKTVESLTDVELEKQNFEMKNLRKVGEVGVKGFLYKPYAAH